MSSVEFVPDPGASQPGAGFVSPGGDELGNEPEAPASPRTRRTIRLGSRSLTARLVAGVVSLVVVLVLGVGASTYFALKAFLYERLDQQVDSVTAANSETVQSMVTYGSSRNGNLRSAQKVWVAILTENGVPSADITVQDTPGFERMDVSRSVGQHLIHNADSAITITTARGEVIRASAHLVGPSPVGTLYVVAGLSPEDVNETLHRLLFLEFLIGASAVALALFMTYGGVRFSLRGLRRVTTTAQEVAAELGPSGVALQRRVPVTEQGTEVAQLTDSMNTLLSATETQFAARVESEERMRQFLADASHELRTPLTSIRGYAELARMQRAVGGREDEDNLGRIEAEGTRMSRLVEDLLMLARGDDTGNAPQRVFIDTDELIGDAVSGARAAFPDRQIEVDAMLPHPVVGDPDQLLRVVRNLITNAVVHTPPGPPIRVRALAEGNGVAIQVVDGGPGLAPEDAAHVFERFWRADKARTRARGGSGLGLSIVASIVRAHGGAVRFESSIEGGSTVTVWLPSATGDS